MSATFFDILVMSLRGYLNSIAIGLRLPMTVDTKSVTLKTILWRSAISVLAVAIFIFAIKSLLRLTRSIDPKEVWIALEHIPMSHIFWALVVVAFGYAILTLYDAIALRHMDIKLPFRKVSLTSFTAYAIGHTVGLAVFSASGVRYRMYRVNNLSAANIANVVWLVSLAYSLGVATLVGIFLTFYPETTVDMMQGLNSQLAQVSQSASIPDFLASSRSIRNIGLLLSGLIIALLVWSGKAGRHIETKGWRFDLPPATILLQQIIISIIDLASVAFVLYLLLPHDAHVGYLTVFSAFIQSTILVMISQVPGGLGVFELAMIASLPEVDKVGLLATLLVFRFLYYIVPFVVAVLLFLAHEIWLRWYGSKV